MPSPIRLTHLALLMVAQLLFVGQVSASVPGTLAITGTIKAQGGATADGKYIATFSIYAVPKGGSALWTEGMSAVDVKGGIFSKILGTKTPLTPALLVGIKEAWLGVAINVDPEQPRVRLHSVAFAIQAATATGLECSGCVGPKQLAAGAISAAKVGFTFAGSKTKGGPANVALDLQCTGCVSLIELKIDGDLDLGGNAIKAKNASIATIAAQTINATVVSATSFVGDGSKLSGIKTPAGSCKIKGQVVKGIDPDGTLICVAGGGAGGLPPDGIDEISNGLIFNQFVDSAKSKGPVPIPDNNPIGVSDTLDFPDVGLAQKLTVFVDVENSKLDSVEITLYDPSNQKYVLLSKGAGKGTKLKTSYPTPTKTTTGDLTTWIGKNPKGKWRLKVTDEAFLNNQSDGAIKSWRIDIQTLSNKKIQIKGDLIVDGSITGSNGDTNFDGKVVFKNSVHFQGDVSFTDIKEKTFKICSDPAPNGPCTVRLYGGRSFLEAAQHCASKKADICTDSQSTGMRKLVNVASIYNFDLRPNWTNSFADNDGKEWNNANGGTGDNHSESEKYSVPCCHNITPPTPGEQKVGGIRVLKIHNSADTIWDVAVSACLALKADLCDKGQYRVIRAQGKVSAAMWASDHSDNDGNQASSAIGNTSDNTGPDHKYGYACCATNRDKLSCPAGATDMQGVCVAKIQNSGTNWSNASTACANLGARLCSIAQTAVLRKAGKVTHNSSWTASYSDNDGSQAKVGVGNAGDNHGTSSSYGYACCY